MLTGVYLATKKDKTVYGDDCQHGGLNRLCRAGGPARDAFPVRAAAPHAADCQRAGRGDPDGAGRHCLAHADCAAKPARRRGHRAGWRAFLCRDYLPFKE